LIETCSWQRREGGWLGEWGHLTFLETPRILCANPVAGKGWREKNGEGKDTKRELLSTV